MKIWVCHIIILSVLVTVTSGSGAVVLGRRRLWVEGHLSFVCNLAFLDGTVNFVEKGGRERRVLLCACVVVRHVHVFLFVREARGNNKLGKQEE